MKKIISGLLASVLALFSGGGSLQASRQTRTSDRDIITNCYQFPGEKLATAEIMSAIKARDIAAIEAMMCEDVRQNVDDLHSKLDALIDDIDGEIIEFDDSPAGGTDVANNGKRIRAC